MTILRYKTRHDYFSRVYVEIRLHCDWNTIRPAWWRRWTS